MKRLVTVLFLAATVGIVHAAAQGRSSGPPPDPPRPAPVSPRLTPVTAQDLIAHASATALLYGQLRSGGWEKAIDFDPNGSLSAEYRNGMGSGKNNSQLDDDTSQSVIRLLSRLDAAMGHTDPALEEAVGYALDRMLAEQLRNGEAALVALFCGG